MKKLFVYEVMGYEFEDVEAFGSAWEQAKAKATELHCPIYRQVIKGNEVRLQVYYKGGLFNSIKFIKPDFSNVMQF
jgi:hypothetical protein